LRPKVLFSFLNNVRWVKVCDTLVVNINAKQPHPKNVSLAKQMRCW